MSKGRGRLEWSCPSVRVKCASMRLLVLLAVPAVSAGAALRAQPPKPSAATGLIVGIVVDAGTGKPVSGAIVSISSPAPATPPFPRQAPAALPRVLTGTDGRFVYRNLPPGNYSIVASRPGHVEGAYGRRRPGGPSVWLALAEGERTADVVVRVWKHAAISGTVLDEAGEGVVGARVRSWRRAFDRGRYAFMPASTGVTDDRGIYRIGSLVPGDYVVGVSATQVAGAELPSQPLEASSSMAVTGPDASGFVRTEPVPPPHDVGRNWLYSPSSHTSTHIFA